MSVFNGIRFRRTQLAELPHALPLGDPIFCTDTGSLYVGMGEGKSLKEVRDLKTLKIIQDELKIIQSKFANDKLSLERAIDDLDTKYTTQLDIIDKRLTNVELNGGGGNFSKEIVTPYRFVESFVSNGQKVFVLTSGMYVPNLERLEVFVGGVFQKSGRDYAETNASTITFVETIPNGVVVDIIVYTKSVSVLNHTHPEYLGRTEKAQNSERLNGYADKVLAEPNSIVRRDSDGNIKTHERFVFADNKCIREVDERIQWGNSSDWHNIHDTQTLPVEEGSWQPTIYGSTYGVMTPTAQYGMYTRVGKVITVNGSIRVESGRQGATGELRIGGLPFIPRGTTVTGSIGYFRGIEVGSGHQLGVIAEVRTSYLRVIASDLKSDDTSYFYVNCGSHMNGNIIDLSFSLTYKIE